MDPIDRQRPFECSIFVTAACLAALFTTGCDECQSGATTCEGDRGIAYCIGGGDEEGPSHWTHNECPVACRQVVGMEATCVDSPEPVAGCANVSDGTSICLSRQIGYCWQGYVIALGGCDSATHCEMTGCGALCVVGDAPDPRCTSDAASFCDGNAMATCKCGFETSPRPCGIGEVCHDKPAANNESGSGCFLASP